jgi:hypothetical protein
MKNSFTLAFALLLLCTGAALASPHGETPAEETVCDNETGAAFGLCNAYCEAMDCETDEPNASATACSRVRGKFQQITGRDLPCEEPPTCPCANSDFFFAGLIAGDITITECFTEPVNGMTDGILIPIRGPVYTYAGEINGAWECGTPNGPGSQSVTAAQSRYCAQLLEEAANSQGVACVAP